jgi:hypothetical protein
MPTGKMRLSLGTAAYNHAAMQSDGAAKGTNEVAAVLNIYRNV